MTNMIEVKTAELEFGALDWCVAQIEGLEVELTPPNYGDGTSLVFITGHDDLYRPSTDWSQGGPLIEKHKIDFAQHPEGIEAFSQILVPGSKGDTYLIAACRAIVASKLGDTVQVPRELLP